MYLDQGFRLGDPSPSNAGGLILRASQDDSTSFTVAHVVENPPADEAGIQIADPTHPIWHRTVEHRSDSIFRRVSEH